MAGYVYIITAKSEDSGLLCKIGSAVDPVKRMSQLQTANPAKLWLRTKFYFPDESYKEAERVLHRELSSFRLSGEWFKIPEEKEMDFMYVLQQFHKNEVWHESKSGFITYGMFETYCLVDRLMDEKMREDKRICDEYLKGVANV